MYDRFDRSINYLRISLTKRVPGNERAIRMAISAKPGQDRNNQKDSFYNIGG